MHLYPEGTPLTKGGGVDMFLNGCCSACEIGFSPYLILPPGSSDGKYYCFANKSEASENGNQFLSEGGPSNCGGSGNTKCTTAAGIDMYRSGNCCPCGSRLSPYLILPPGGTDGKYYCFASDNDAISNGNKLISKGGPSNCV